MKTEVRANEGQELVIRCIVHNSEHRTVSLWRNVFLNLHFGKYIFHYLEQWNHMRPPSETGQKWLHYWSKQLIITKIHCYELQIYFHWLRILMKRNILNCIHIPKRHILHKIEKIHIVDIVHSILRELCEFFIFWNCPYFNQMLNILTFEKGKGTHQ